MDSADSSLDRLSTAVSGKHKSCRYWWRLFATGLSFVVFGMGTLLFGITFLIVSQTPFQQPTKQRWLRNALHRGAQAYIGSMRLMGLLTFSKNPQQAITAEGVIITANHPTLLDAVLIIAMCKDLCCITKTALWSNPLTSSLVRMAGYIRNDADDLIEQASSRLHKGENLLIFPEGTRNSYDDQLDFKRGAANLAILTKADILPVVIKCQPRTLQKHARWYHIPDTVPHFTVTTLATLRTMEHVQQAAPRTIQYRQLTTALKDIYRASLSQVLLTGENKLPTRPTNQCIDAGMPK